jgi:hypothetical protein
MKKIFLVIFFLQLHNILYSQADSTRLEFFPLHKSDTWQYYCGNYNGGGGYYRTWILTAVDTLLNNGKRYFGIADPRFLTSFTFYVDSLWRVQSYSSSIGDTCSGCMNEVNTYRLAEKDSSIWRIC